MSVFNILAGQANPGQNRSPTSYTVTPSSLSVVEGTSITFNILTSNIPNATVLYWTNAGTTTGADFTDGLNSGSLTIQNNNATVTKTLVDDSVAESPETIIFQLRTISTSGTIVATGTTVTVTDIAYSVQFNGTSQYLSTNTNTSTATVFTFECFFYLTSYLKSTGAGGYLGILYSGTNTSTPWLRLSGTVSSITGIYHSWIGSGGPPDIGWSGLNLQLNQWYHIAISRNASNWSMWLNGIKQTRTLNTNPGTTYAAGPLRIGVNLNNAGYAGYFPGYISNLRIVTGNNVYDPAGGDITVPISNLASVTGTVLLTCQSSTFIDNSGTGITISPVNTPTINSTVVPF